MRTVNREKPLPHNLCSFTSSLCTCPASSASTVNSVFFQHMVWYGPTSETAWMQRRQKKWSKYTAFTELKKITSRIYSNCSNYCSLFFKSFKFRCCSFYFIQKKLQLTVQMCCLLYFLLHSTLSKEKLRGGFWWVLLLYVGLSKRVIFLFGSNYMNPEDNYERLIDFWVKFQNFPISTCLI